MAFVLENGRLLDRYRIGTDTGCIVSNRIGYCGIGRYHMHHCIYSNIRIGSYRCMPVSSVL